MSKQLECTIKRYAGSITIPEWLTLPQAQAFEMAFDEIGKLEQSETVEKYALERLALPAICMIVEKWELSNFPEHPTPETFPMTPKASAAQLLAWVIGEISKLYYEETEIPNE